MTAIRDDGLFMLHSALAAFVQDPQRLDSARRRFSKSPPSYRSQLSGSTTRSQSPSPPCQEQQYREGRQAQLVQDHEASLPRHQFEAQVSEETTWVWKARNQYLPPPILWLPSPDIQKLAAQNVKERWIEQGIWKDEWNNNHWPGGRWKHEETLELESEFETDSEAEFKPVVPILGLKKTEAKPTRPKSDGEMLRIAERRRIREREREASRPYHQFVYQVSKARERIQDELGFKRAPNEDSADINTKAYENVKDTWIKRGIWNKKWSVLPGISWKHEHPLEELIADDAVFAQANGLDDHRRQAEEAPPRRIFWPLPPLESSHGQAPGVQLELPAAIDPMGLQNGHENSSSPVPRSRHRLTQSGECSSAAAQRPLRGARETSRDAGPEACTSLRPVNPSKVSKASRKRIPAPRGRLSISRESPSAPVPPRRSKRLQEAMLSAAEDPTETIWTDSFDGSAQSRPMGIPASSPTSTGSAKPRGVSKRRRGGR